MTKETEKNLNDLRNYFLSLVDESFDGFAGEKWVKKVITRGFPRRTITVYTRKTVRGYEEIQNEIFINGYRFATKEFAAHEKIQKEKLKQLINTADFSKFRAEEKIKELLQT